MDRTVDLRNVDLRIVDFRTLALGQFQMLLTNAFTKQVISTVQRTTITTLRFSEAKSLQMNNPGVCGTRPSYWNAKTDCRCARRQTRTVASSSCCMDYQVRAVGCMLKHRSTAQSRWIWSSTQVWGLCRSQRLCSIRGV